MKNIYKDYYNLPFSKIYFSKEEIIKKTNFAPLVIEEKEKTR